MSGFQAANSSHHRLRFTAVATAVLLLAAVFRIIALPDVPPGLAQDEVLDADIAAFIRAGHHALFFREGYGHEPLYHYWAAPFAPLLGDNVLAIRLPSVFLGLLLVAATMRWARRDFGPVTAVTAGIGLAVSWWPIIFSRIGIRPIMEPLFWVAAAWFWPRPGGRPARALITGLLLGLSLYTYTAAQVMFAWPVLVIGIQLLTHHPSWKKALMTGGLVLVAAGLTAVPLYLTWRADPSLLQRVDQLGGPLAAWRTGHTRPILEAIGMTAGVFTFTGDPRWTYTLPARPLFDLLTSLFFYAGLAVALSRIRHVPYGLLVTWLMVGLLPSMLTPQAPSTIRLIGALPPVFVITGLSIAAISKPLSVSQQRSKKHRWRFMTYGLLMLLLGLNIGRTIRDGFINWPQAVETRLNHYQATLWDMAQYWQDNPVTNLVIADPFFEAIDADSFRRSAGQETGARWIQAGPGTGGAIVFPYGASDGRLYVPETAPLSPILQALLGLPTTPHYHSAQSPIFVVYTLPPLPPIPELAAPVTFDGLITLEGHKILTRPDASPATLVTLWRVENPLPWNLKAFAHLLDSQGKLVAQHDGFDAAPAMLQSGDRVIQLHPLPIPAVNEPYTLQVGLYTPHDNRRLTHTGNPADVVVLAYGPLFDEK